MVTALNLNELTPESDMESPNIKKSNFISKSRITSIHYLEGRDKLMALDDNSKLILIRSTDRKNLKKPKMLIFLVKTLDCLIGQKFPVSCADFTDEYIFGGTLDGEVLMWNLNRIDERVKQREIMKKAELYTLQYVAYNEYVDNKAKRKRRRLIQNIV